MGDAGEGEAALQFTPTWIVAAVCSIIVVISLAAERGLHHLGKTLKKNNQRPLYEALLKVKEELMLLGFISLLLTVLQGTILRICIPRGWTDYMLPCKKPADDQTANGLSFTKANSIAAEILGSIRPGRLLSEGVAAAEAEICQKQVLSEERSLFICEDDKTKSYEIAGPNKVTHVHELDFIKERYKGVGKDSMILCWMFRGSVTESDYKTMRLGFIMTHCRANPKFDFHKYMLRALESDFKKIVGTRLAHILLDFIHSLNCLGAYRAILYPFFLQLLLAVGTKLEHIIAELAYDVAEKHTAIEGDLVVKPSDEHFWFGQPTIILHLIHFTLFQNAFELAYFFYVLLTYGFESCFMDHVGFLVPRLVVGIIIQLMCSYSTLPLYAIVTQMGSYYKKEIFNEHVQQGVIGWAKKVKGKRCLKECNSI
ncbi:hypothetical protein PR202_gb01257 [Eleusine coracana subsp. coracana]|uniref:MLO-like protein n=1 Tax=Eleusine coracana subsp. coracana TaxID=191504 RepID=A0AAV5DVS6_ELECO|nr:hypothetical protein PR202_gb01257 [Eleusine coracana subsp. coracana]